MGRLHGDSHGMGTEPEHSLPSPMLSVLPHRELTILVFRSAIFAISIRVKSTPGIPGVCLCHKEINRFLSSSTAPRSEILGYSEPLLSSHFIIWNSSLQFLD